MTADTHRSLAVSDGCVYYINPFLSLQQNGLTDDTVECKDVDALQQHLEQVRYKVPKGVKRVPWIETLGVVVNRSVRDENIGPTEDFRREAKL